MNFIIFLFSVLNMPSDNFVEVEIKLESPDHIQLFTITQDSTPRFTEKQSYWKRISKGGEWTTVRWKLKNNLIYKNIRLDVSTGKQHKINIKHIRWNLNGKARELVGGEIFTEFIPTIYLKLIECDDKVVKFRSVKINEFMDPTLNPVDRNLDSVSKNNFQLNVNLKIKHPAVMFCYVTDTSGIRTGTGKCISDGDNTASFSLFLKNNPKTLRLIPTASNENEVLIKNIELEYKGKSIDWNSIEIFENFKVFNSSDKSIVEGDLFLENKFKKRWLTLYIQNEDITFTDGNLAEKLSNLPFLIAAILVLFIFNKKILSRKSISNLFEP